MSTEEVKAHFTARAAKYDASSHWCTDPELAERVLGLLEPSKEMQVLDVACGTGLVSQWFHGRVAHVLGVVAKGNVRWGSVSVVGHTVA